MSDETRIWELRKEIEKLCGNCDRPDKEELGKIILSSMTLGFNEGLKAPSADRPHKVIVQVTFDEEKLRESAKEAVERFKEEYELIDRPQGKWINGHHINGVYYKRCDQCFAEIEDSFFGESSFDVNFCPNCGAQMM